jgi:exopolyphosphatase/guanosine-5'-triphosphate,3'-diphosphate pyrophosphatase
VKRAQKRAPSVAVIDIGSNSVRLVVYEKMARSLVSVFNEKTLCGLGREVQSTGLLAPDAVDKALTSLRRFHALCKIQRVGRIYAIATAACRDASNGPDFIAKAERICGCKIEILSGPREAQLSAQGVISGVHKPDGVVGDLGGGSLELIDVRGHRVSGGVTLPLGSLALQDLSHKSLKRAERIVSTELAEVPRLAAGRGRTFYAVGGTWRALARIHIIQSGYPLKGPKRAARFSLTPRSCSNTSFAPHGRRPSPSRPSACARDCCFRCCRRPSATRTGSFALRRA